MFSRHAANFKALLRSCASHFISKIYLKALKQTFIGYCNFFSKIAYFLSFILLIFDSIVGMYVCTDVELLTKIFPVLFLPTMIIGTRSSA